MNKIEIVGYPQGNLFKITQKQFELLNEKALIQFDDEWTKEKPNGQWGFNNHDEDKIIKLLQRDINPPIYKPIVYLNTQEQKATMESGRYLVVRKDRKTHFETFNGSGFSHNNSEISHFYLPKIN